MRVPHPLTGLPEPIRIDRRVLSSLLRVPLYSPQLSAVLPYALAQATDGDFTPLVALSAAVAGGINENFAAGMHFAVVCAEDMPRVDAGQRAKIAATRFGNAFLDVYERACKGVPSRPVPSGFYEIPASRTPVLVLSGGLDPGDSAAPRRPRRGATRQRAPHRGPVSRSRHQHERLRADAAGALHPRRRLRQGRRRLPDPPAGRDVLRADRPRARRGIGDSEATGAMIEVEHLAKQFDARVEGRRARVVAVEDIGFTALDGRITALLGPNGAGKTTTMRVVAGLVRADRGHARVGGVDVAADPHAVRAQLGMLSDARGLYARLTARENVHYYADLRQVPRADGDQRLAMIADLLDMGALLDRRIEGFSTGERMKVALARALIHDPQHLILDEPTNGLDVVSTRALRRLLQHLRAAGKCIVVSTHIMQEVEQLADEIVIVAHGRTVARGTAEMIRATAGTATLEDAFVALAYPAHGEPTA